MKSIEISVPGKVMLAGEYAVLRGGHALTATTACGMHVTVDWDPLAAAWEIESNIWSDSKFVADNHTPQTDMLCRAVQFMSKKTGLHGGNVRVRSDIEIKHGIGSSSALRLAICAAFVVLRSGPDLNRPGKIPLEAMHLAWQLQSESQGVASGYDITSQFAGGLVEFSFYYEDNHWTPHWFRHDLNGLAELVHVYVGGEGAPTGETIQSTSSWMEGGNRFEKLLDYSEHLVDMFNMAIQWPTNINISRLTQSVGIFRNLFAGSPNFPGHVAEKLSSIPGLDKSWSWKTTGAGGEDAIILIGRIPSLQPAVGVLSSFGWYKLNFGFANEMAKIVSLASRQPSRRRNQKSEIL